jgi:hypothetical protein
LRFMMDFTNMLSFKKKKIVSIYLYLKKKKIFKKKVHYFY